MIELWQFGGAMLIIWIIHLSSWERKFKICEYKHYYSIATNCRLVPFWYRDWGMLFLRSGEIDFSLTYRNTDDNKFNSKEKALDRLNKFYEYESERKAKPVKTYKIIKDEDSM
jgi:hypothetical protein